MITLDTSGLLAVLNEADPKHREAKQALLGDRGPYLVPATTLCEVGYLIEHRLGLGVLDAFLADLEAREFTLDCGEQDLPRVRELVGRYADLRLGFADASVIACAERNAGKVLTLDVRDFGVVAKEGTIELLP